MVEEQTHMVESQAGSRADPSALGLAAFAVTTFLVSLYNVGASMPLTAFFAIALFYGGMAEFVAGLFEYRRENTFGATAYTSYGALYLAAAGVAWMLATGRITEAALSPGLGWILLAYAVVNLGFLAQSFRVSKALGLVFLGIEVTEILLFIGYFAGETAGAGAVAIAGVIGILTSIVTCYAAWAALLNSAAGRDVLLVGRPHEAEQPDVHLGRRAA